MHRVCARWIPRLLKVEEKQKRISCSKEFLRRLRSGQEEFLNRIITTDETWLHYYDQEGKRESRVWKTSGTPPPKKAKVSRSVYNVYGQKRYAPKARCSSWSDYYSKVVRRDLMHAIRKEKAQFSRKYGEYHLSPGQRSKSHYRTNPVRTRLAWIWQDQ